ncbi:fumarylacetoacetate hydrolase family protein [Actinophytocola oryzae]|uniref:2-keto-4-pentenoate hydratase/2-oxohepta-3-ene-1,7-dioic acid hydratase in catechol pathway n=1 Tax=Actinophytocola oryzae TaxID=502181 RepID=A0A4R7W5E2_9PSEU|nr:fumarylacetoacetate hydrolase family protein [Actinophytocola oryzae]TDV57844.1 2-keto-4-pentenoate hydratase/2-oxohepta-3-ene-1,7-dioic acid hydratase in catechol pathway [Actinophytocola oryzae]
MRYCRYETADGPRWGVVDPSTSEVTALRGDPIVSVETDGPAGPVADLRLLAPVTPALIVCAGRNYGALLAERGWDRPAVPSLFHKSPNTLVGPGAAIRCPDDARDVAHEGELAVVIGRRLSGAGEEEAAAAVFGYSCANDVTVRDWLHPTPQWVLAKSTDSHCPIGPWVETDVGDPTTLHVRTTVNGEPRQDGDVGDLVFPIPSLLAFISRTITLLPGDVVLTGSPAGVGELHPGDVVSVEVDRIGMLTNPVEHWA